ncbi:protocatechuate 3,4-dioxygenase subunit alpha [Roseibium aquae]|uniref:Protocatechuate 3,4-dioxygenase subunit alpha n=1 Tax=Roseibium aquae TaxID=1323746 RepID=A0A916TFB4_9HYPH|nr:protocatechuate 3,4-dioxygenase subunit alpha [Roseibium aquae]GGB42816.1 protocatechuate 3,4-dioxygenase subunit alpha [Roseibium aquae]
MPTRVPDLRETASQTAGPYVHIGLVPAATGIHVLDRTVTNVVVRPDTPGEHITIEGVVHDGEGMPVRDAVLESWQADASGRHAHPEDPSGSADIRGFGRMAADFGTGVYSLHTVKPGPVPGRDGVMQAPHISFWIVARGINVGLHTRLYFSDELERNAADPILASIGSPDRRKTLIADRTLRDGKPLYRFDIHLQGDRETVFFDI